MSRLTDRVQGYISAIDAAEQNTRIGDDNAILADVLSRLLNPGASYPERINDVLDLLNDTRRVDEVEQ